MTGWLVNNELKKYVEGSYRSLIEITVPEFAWSDSGNP
jgi:hypothetical protein